MCLQQHLAAIHEYQSFSTMMPEFQPSNMQLRGCSVQTGTCRKDWAW